MATYYVDDQYYFMELYNHPLGLHSIVCAVTYLTEAWLEASNEHLLGLGCALALLEPAQ